MDAVLMDRFFLITLIILFNVILLLGRLYRQTSGPGNIGLESALVSVTLLGRLCRAGIDGPERLAPEVKD